MNIVPNLPDIVPNITSNISIGRFQGARTPFAYRRRSSDQSNRYKYFVQLSKIKLNIPVNFKWRRRDFYLVLFYTFIPWGILIVIPQFFAYFFLPMTNLLVLIVWLVLSQRTG